MFFFFKLKQLFSSFECFSNVVFTIIQILRGPPPLPFLSCPQFILKQ